MNELKVRIAGDPQEVERLTTLLCLWAKRWGKRKIFRVKRYNRDPATNPYHRTFGSAKLVNYIKMKIPNIEEVET